MKKKCEFKGIIHEIKMPITGMKTAAQDFILFIPGYTNEFGEKLGQDDYMQIRAFGDKAELLQKFEKGDKVEVFASLNGKQWNDPIKGEMYFLNLNLYSMTKI